MGDIDVRDATAAERRPLATVLARAFHDDPVMWHLISERNRAGRVARFFGFDIDGLSERGRVLTTDDLAGGALWAAPDRWRTPTAEVVKGTSTMLRSFGFRVPRALRTLSAIEAVHPTAPHWYLAVLGTDPSHQGRGIGSALLAPVLATCDEEGIGAYLESSKESNIPFYGRHGFEVTEEVELPGGGPSVWGMWRTPR